MVNESDFLLGMDVSKDKTRIIILKKMPYHCVKNKKTESQQKLNILRGIVGPCLM